MARKIKAEDAFRPVDQAAEDAYIAAQAVKAIRGGLVSLQLIASHNGYAMGTRLSDLLAQVKAIAEEVQT